jgi:23S rRNA (cytosine1962-C5)-methyltransferase
MLPQVVLKAQKARTFSSRHPWVFEKAIERIEGDPSNGDEVDLVTHHGKFVARGILNHQSRIRVRLYTWTGGEELDAEFWRRKIQSAIALRKHLGYDDPQGAARLVFSEGDGLSGLVVDRYADYLAVQVTSLGIASRLPMIIGLLVELTNPRGIVLRTERGMTQAEGLDLRDGPYWGQAPEGPVVVLENSLRWQVDLLEGQKTGFYLDQRENRQVTARYVQHRRVLDMFCYTGGFSIAAGAAGRASEVLAFDSSHRALELARVNAELNAVTNVRFQAGDAFEVLNSLAGAGERFGAVILDPPKFARARTAREEALRAYHWLNRMGIRLLEQEGFLITCSCSGLISREDFLDVLLGAAQQARRHVQVLEQRGASPDHPAAVNCPESEYLKCFVCRVV